MALLVYGVTGLTAKESIVFTAFGFGISAILCSFIGIMVVLVVTMCLFAFEELGALPRLFGAQIILIALWNLIFTVVLPDEKARTILGFESLQYFIVFALRYDRPFKYRLSGNAF